MRCATSVDSRRTAHERGARRADRRADSGPPDLRVSAALGLAAVPGRPAHHAENRLSHLCAQRVVRTPAPDYTAAAWRTFVSATMVVELPNWRRSDGRPARVVHGYG